MSFIEKNVDVEFDGFEDLDEDIVAIIDELTAESEEEEEDGERKLTCPTA